VGLMLVLSGKPQVEGIKISVPRPARRAELFDMAAILFALSLYGLFLRIRIPGPVGEFFRYDLLRLSLPALFVLYFSFRHSGWIARLLGVTTILILASFALASLWNTGASEEPIIMGLLPYSDSSVYYTDAQLLLNGFPISAWGGRPIFSLFLAVLLRLTGSNLQVSIAIMVAITMLCCYLAASEVNQSFGPAAAASLLYLLFIYYRQFIGSTESENLGLAFGALSLAFLLQSARKKDIRPALFGLFLASLALNTRPGPFFLLPALLVWFTLTFRRTGRLRSALWAILTGSAVILLPFVINFALIKSLAVPQAEIFSRFPDTFYGLAAGGKNWEQIDLDHPFVSNLPASQQSSTIYALAFAEIRANPARFLGGVGQFFLDFFSVQKGAFAFIRQIMEIRLALYGLSILGLVYVWIKRKQARTHMLLACLVGILLSTPFVPPRDSDWMRTYAAVLPFIVIVPSLSLALFNRGMNGVQNIHMPKEATFFQSPAFILSIVLVVSAVAGPFGVKAQSPIMAIKPVGCPVSQAAFYIRIYPGSYVNVIGDAAAPASHLPGLRISDLIFSVNDFAYRKVFAGQPYQPGMTILNTLDLASEQHVWLALPANNLPVDGSLIAVCGRYEKGNEFIFANDFVRVGK
jgi:Dolichyl-phosphate-mannose-protein mannosyltransferase